MPIKYNEDGLFHLYNNEISYIIGLLPNAQPGHLYFGRRLQGEDDFTYLQPFKPRSLMACVDSRDTSFSLQHSRHEYPAYGNTDFHYPALEIKQENGSRISNFTYSSHQIYAGKRRLEGLPATYVENKNEADTLEISLYDALIETEIILTYTIYTARPVITRNVRFINHGNEPIVINRAMSLCLDFPDSEYDMIQLDGAWSRERHLNRKPLSSGVQSIHSTKGTSSAEHNPFVIFARKNTNEHEGEAVAVNLVYSGNYLAQMEVDTFESARFIMGIHPDTFEWKLDSGDTFQTPEAVIVHSISGLGQISRTLHDLYNQRLVRGVWRDRERPIIVNNWEATGFDFDQEKILSIVKAAAETGVELFVLDDGWFGSRNNDESGLGDWKVNLDKLPDGIEGLARKTEKNGLRFGIWIEPEMVNEDSDLFRHHPDWILHVPGRSRSKSRNQYVLDFSREEVVEHIYKQICALLAEAKISYIKWDMNRYITECFSVAAGADEQGKIFHKYVLGVYSLYEQLIQKFPHVLFESCSSGGARFDPGMLYYAPQTWTSDNTDAIERVFIQYGTSMAYPISSMGAHVSAVPNQQVGRVTPLSSRFNVAMFGAFGYEFDLSILTSDQKEIIKKQTDFVKKYRRTIQFGDFFRLASPMGSNNKAAAWMSISKNKETAVMCCFRVLSRANNGWEFIKLAGLEPNANYEVYLSRDGKENKVGKYHASTLMYAGVPAADEYFDDNAFPGDYVSFCLVLHKVIDNVT